MTLIPEDIVGGHYKIISLLGIGNFGKTYLAEDLHAINRKCAVKQFTFTSNNPSAFDKAQELFAREAAVLYNLSNPLRNQQIPQFFAYFTENQEFYLVQELIEGLTLSEELQQKDKLDEDNAVDLLKDVLETLKFIHNEGIIHRDIKPDNLIRRNQDGKIILIDFGAVKEVVAQSANTNPEIKATLIYTAGYAPPEQQRGEPHFNSDIYALGITVLEALTGLEPEKLKDNKTGEVIWPSPMLVSENFKKILERMVEEDYQQRYQSADEVLNAIKDWRTTQIVSPGQKPSTVIQQSNASSYSIPEWRRIAVLAPLVMVIVAGTSFLAVRVLMNPRPSVSNAPVIMRESNPLPAQATTQTSPTRPIHQSSPPVLSNQVSEKPTVQSSSKASNIDTPIRFIRAKPTQVNKVRKQVSSPSSPTPQNIDSDQPIRFRKAN